MVDSAQRAAQEAAAAEEARSAVEAIDTIPRLADAVRRKLDEVTHSPEKQHSPGTPLYMTLNMKGRALFDLAFILAHVEGAEAQKKAVELCERAGVAYTMVRIIEKERDDGDGFAAKSAVLALSILANLACHNGHEQLMQPEINALDLFLALLNDPDSQALSPLVLPYSIAGVRNLSNQKGAAEQLRKAGGEKLLQDLVRRGKESGPNALDEHTLVHATKALMNVNELAPKAPLGAHLLPGAKKKAEEEAERRRKELEKEHAELVKRRDAAVKVQRNVRRYQTEKKYAFAKKVEKSDNMRVGPSQEMLVLIQGTHAEEPGARSKAVLKLANFAAGCSSVKLAELALHTDDIVALLNPATEPPSTMAYAACVIANLSYTRNGQRSAIRAGGVKALLGVIRHIVSSKSDGSKGNSVSTRNAASSQAAAALQNLSYELPPVCDELVSEGAVKVLRNLMSFEESDDMCREYAAGVLTNLKVYATVELDPASMQAATHASELIKDKHKRSVELEYAMSVRIQAVWRGVNTRRRVAKMGKK